MARTQSKTSSTPAATAVVAPVVAAPVAVAPAETKPKVVRAAPKKAEAAPVAAPAPVVVAAPAEAETETTTLTAEDRNKAVLASIDAQIASLKTLRAQVVANFKSTASELKAAQKAGGRRRRAPSTPEEGKAPKAPSGIVKPTNISDAMCAFMGKPAGTQLARTEVTKFITTYIKQHNLQDSVSKRNINPDAALKSLLAIPDTETLTYFNLQKYMKVHFPKPVVATA